MVVTAPLLMRDVLPTPDALTSTGDTLARPEYSCRYTMPNDLIDVPNVAVTVFVPALMLEA